MRACDMRLIYNERTAWNEASRAWRVRLLRSRGGSPLSSRQYLLVLQRYRAVEQNERRTHRDTHTRPREYRVIICCYCRRRNIEKHSYVSSIFMLSHLVLWLRKRFDMHVNRYWSLIVKSNLKVHTFPPFWTWYIRINKIASVQYFLFFHTLRISRYNLTHTHQKLFKK